MRSDHQRRHAAAREPAPENVVMTRQCRNQACLAMFFVCLRCFSGQAYCSSDCREKNRRAQLREARARYQSSARGRELHRQRQRRYRRRHQACRVTDHPVVRPLEAAEKMRCAERSGISAPFSCGLMLSFNIIKPRGLESFQFPTKIGTPSSRTKIINCSLIASLQRWEELVGWSREEPIERQSVSCSRR